MGLYGYGYGYPYAQTRRGSAFSSSTLLFGSTPKYTEEVDKLWMEDEAGKVDLTPLQGADIVGQGSGVYASLSSQIVISYGTAFEIEFEANLQVGGTYQAIIHKAIANQSRIFYQDSNTSLYILDESNTGKS